tara:strand:- start:1099 stop:2733 length:1635 start_codon:yes stop_codon:yes gene_type:complete
VSDNQLLKISGLRVEVPSPKGNSTILHDVGLTLNRGEVLGLIGESGAGKSTLGLAAAGFVKPGCAITGGSILFDGKELVGMDRTLLEKLRGVRVAYVAQSASASFNPSFQLGAQCAETALQHHLMSGNEADARVQELFAEMMLPNPEQIVFRYPHQVSGGQLQRAMTAMAMVCRPDLIIFDEPTTALDVTTQVGVLASIRSIVEHYGTAAIYVTHDLAVVAQMADRIMVMKNGRMVEQATTREMLSNPKEEYTKSLWSIRNFKTDERSRDAEALVMQIKGINAAYGSHAVLNDINFDVPKARTVAIVGESGSGKSTLARVITGLHPPVSGSIKFEDKPLAGHVSKRSRYELESVQIIHQYPDKALNPRQRIGDIIARPLRLYFGLKGEELRGRVRQILQTLELDPDQMYNRLPHELSGGQKQRVCIGRALAAKPKVIICDEVTSALDQVVAEGILKTLVRIQQEFGVSYVVITHDIGLVQAIADEVVVLKSGNIIEAGSKSQVLSPPFAEYTQLLLASTPEMDPDWLTNLLHARAGEKLANESL